MVTESMRLLKSDGSSCFVDLIESIEVRDATSEKPHLCTKTTPSHVDDYSSPDSKNSPSNCMLECKQCTLFFLDSGVVSKELQSSASEGCKRCKAIIDIVREMAGLLTDEALPWRLVTFRPHIDNEDTFSVKFWWQNEKDRTTNTHFDLFVMPGKSSPWPSLVPATSISGDTSSTLAMKRARLWLESCQDEHATCPRNDNVQLPTRLVEIDFKNEGYILRLVECRGMLGRYVCLSHCWGKHHKKTIIPTTLTSLKKHLKNIAWESLSKTFKDAVIVTWKLGMKYIWIDSLCIIQNCAEDWRVEASKMASVYRNSSMTIAASKSRGSDEGCFSKASPEYFTHSFYYRDNDIEATIHSRGHLIHGSEWPLLTRGWVHQERLLSPRMLHFGPHEIVWECLTGTTCECSQSGNTRSNLHNKSHHDKFFTSEPHSLDFRNRWRDLVGDFCKLDLSFGKDRLPALAGLATQMKSHRAGKYLAGLWEESLVGDMLWIFDSENETPSMRDPGSHAPTWSWASVDNKGVNYHMIGAHATGPNGTFTCRDHIVETFAEIHDVRCTPLGPDDMGEIQEGTITLSAPTIEARIRHVSTSQPKTDDDQRFITKLYMNELNEPTKDSKVSTELLFAADYDIAGPGKHHVESDALVKVIKMAFVEGTENMFGNIFLCIVLHCVDEKLETYERLGLTLFSTDHEQTDWFARAEPLTVKII